jgi:hypothetical protein
MKARHLARYLALIAIFPTIATAADQPIPRTTIIRVAISDPDDVRELVFVPDGRSVSLPAGRFIEHRDEKYAPLWLKASEPLAYTLSWRFQLSDCATDAPLIDKAEASDPQREFKAYQRVDNTDFDSRWFKSHTKWRWGDSYYTAFCLDGPSTQLVLTVRSPDGAYDPETVAAVASSFADAFGPGTAPVSTDAIGYVRGVPNRPTPTPIAEVYPASLVPVAQACQVGNQINCEALRAFSQLQQGCNRYERWRMIDMPIAPPDSAPFCVSTAKVALKQKDYRVAALYFQRACDAGDGSACKEALKQKAKAGK